MAFTVTWDAAFKAKPVDAVDSANTLGQVDRDTRAGVEERAVVDHEWLDATDGGKHKKVTLLEQGSDPVPAANEGSVFTKVRGVTAELHYKDEDGVVTRLTDNGSLVISADKPVRVFQLPDTEVANSVLEYVSATDVIQILDNVYKLTGTTDDEHIEIGGVRTVGLNALNELVIGVAASKMEINGDLDSALKFENNKFIKMKDFAGVSKSVLAVGVDDKIALSTTTGLAVAIKGAVQPQVSAGVGALQDILSIAGETLASKGHLELSNGIIVNWESFDLSSGLSIGSNVFVSTWDKAFSADTYYIGSQVNAGIGGQGFYSSLNSIQLLDATLLVDGVWNIQMDSSWIGTFSGAKFYVFAIGK